VSSTIMMTGLSTFTNALTLADILSPPAISDRIGRQPGVARPDVLVTQPGLAGGRLFSRTLSMRPGASRRPASNIAINGLREGTPSTGGVSTMADYEDRRWGR
jgi:hypothetical protein